MVYIVTFLALAVIPMALAGYGGYLAAKVLEENERRRALRIVVGLTVLGLLLFGLQQYFAYRTDIARERSLTVDRDRQSAQLENIGTGIEGLKRLIPSSRNDPPEKVLAAAAAKILELDTKTKQLESGIKDITSVRRLSETQEKTVKNEIIHLCSQTKSFNIDLIWENDSETIGYANDFYQILEGTKCWQGYRGAVGEQFKPAVFPRGLTIMIKDPEHPSKEAVALIGALKKAKIPHGIASAKSIPSSTAIFVGFKP